MEPFKRKTGKDASYYVKFMVKGKVYLYSTRTPDKELARARGKDYRAKVIAEEFHLVDLMKSRSSVPSFAQLFKMYEGLPLRAGSTAKKRAIGAMRIVLQAIDADDNSPISVLSAKLALTYQQRRLAEKEKPVTINARLRFARALFSKAAMVAYAAMGLQLRPQWSESFCSVGALQEEERMPEIPTAAQMATAHAALSPFPDVYRAFLLAAYAGLRSAEIKAAKWDWIVDGVLYVGGREFVAKSRKWRPIGLAPAVVVELNKGQRVGEYICGESPTITVVRKLPGMLRDLGFASSTPVHSLRRLFGSNVAAVGGLWAAQGALGHSSPSTTAKHYARQLNLAPAVGMAPLTPPSPPAPPSEASATQ